MKKLLSLLLVLIIFICSFPFSAQAKSDKTFGTCGKNLKWSLNKETSTLTISGTGEMTDYKYEVINNNSGGDYVIINDSFNSPFKYLEYKNLIITEGVTSIGKYAFFRSKIESVTLPSTLKKIGSFAFYLANSIIEINVNKNNNKFLSVDGVLFNKSKTKLILYPSGRNDSYIIPNSVTTINDYAFSYTNLNNVKFSDSIKIIGIKAFQGCKKLKFDKLKLPKHLENLGSDALESISFKKIVIGKNVKKIGLGAIDSISLEKIAVDCNNNYFSSKNGVLFNKKQSKLIFCPRKKAGKYTIPKTVKIIEKYAFYGSELKTLKLNQVKTVREGAFLSSKIKQFDLGKKLQTIGNKAFVNCEMKSISIPKSVKRIDKEAFAACVYIKRIEFSATKKLPKIYDRAFLIYRQPMQPRRITFVVKNSNIRKMLLDKLKKGIGIQKYKVIVK